MDESIAWQQQIQQTISALVGTNYPQQQLTNDDYHKWQQLWQGDEISTAISRQELTVDNYQQLLHSLITPLNTRQPYTSNMVSILTPMEARLLSFDFVILASLNDGSWPPKNMPPIWLSQANCQQLGIANAHHNIARSNHDFYQLLHNKQVIITRAVKSGGRPKLASKLWLRLTKHLPQHQLANRYINLVRYLKTNYQILPIAPPAPSPPLSARPSKFAVTQIEKLLQDPYQIYGAKVLALKPALNLQPANIKFGNFIHLILELDHNHQQQLTITQLFNQALSSLNIQLSQAEQVEWHFKTNNIVLWWRQYFNNLKPSINTSDAEIWGSHSLSRQNIYWQLSAKADLMISTINNELMVIDYKSGTTPTGKQVRAGFSSQLALIALIAGTGGFGQNYTNTKTTKLNWIKVKGNKPCDIINIDYNQELAQITNNGI
ncbi:MAG: PD-(D/E)XK nuclease family protein [Pseudomonadota bacterium]